MFKHILLPIDDSAASRKATRKAIALATEIGARVTGYHAVPKAHGRVYGEGYAFSTPSQAGEMKRRARHSRSVERAAAEARSCGVAYRTVVGEAATPAEGILAAARTCKCDAILIGTNGRRGLSRLALGSVAEQVVRNATIPVLVLR
jgi:nucleotide-binding universal stress UspA family protein